MHSRVSASEVLQFTLASVVAIGDCLPDAGRIITGVSDYAACCCWARLAT